MEKLSVFIITLNEERDIRRCLESVKWAEEIVVVDSKSRDRTGEIAKEFTDKVIIKEWMGYSQQKRFALQNCTGDWVLNIDADEIVTDELKQEIEMILKGEKGTDCAGYLVRFKFYFLGHFLRFGGCYPEYHLRLFRRGSGDYGAQEVHEGIEVRGRVSKTKGHIIHYSYHSLKEYLDKINLYTEIAARKKYEQGERFHAFHLLRFGFEFLLRYIIKLGMLDGISGFTHALLSSFYASCKHLKLWELENRIKREKLNQ